MTKKELISQYKKHRRRILNQLRKLRKKGYDTSEIKIPKIPIKITKGSVRRLEKMTTRSLQEKATRVDYDTGEIISARQDKVRAARARGEARRLVNEAAKKSAEPDTNEYEQEEIGSEYDLFVNRLKETVAAIHEKLLPQFTAIISDALTDGLNNFLSYAEANKEKAVEEMKELLQDPYLSQEKYYEEDVPDSFSFFNQATTLAMYWKDEKLADAVKQTSNIESAGLDSEVWAEASEIPAEFMYM